MLQRQCHLKVITTICINEPYKISLGYPNCYQLFEIDNPQTWNVSTIATSNVSPTYCTNPL